MTDIALPIEKAENPLLKKLKKTIPGTTCRLPSLGLIYPDGVLDPEVTNGELLVFPMTTQDEIMMKTADMLFQGTAITTVFKRCMPQILQPTKLFLHDVEYLLTFLRKVSYGNTLPIKYKCKECGTKAQTHIYDVSLDHLLAHTKNIDKKFAKNLQCKIGDFSVQLNPLSYEEFVVYHQNTQLLEDDSSIEDITKTLISFALGSIASVDNIDDKEIIREWLSDLPRELMEDLSNQINASNNWGMETKYKINCIDCNAEGELSTVLNPLHFFTIPSKQQIKHLTID